MVKIVQEIKYSFNKGDNMIRKLILINIGVFLLVNAVRLIAFFATGNPDTGNVLNHWFYLPADPSRFIYQPWSLFSYMFVHEGFFHILFNMLWLYFIGRIFQEYLGNNKLLRAYLIGGLAGGLLYMAGMNVLPVFRNSVYFPFPLHGASAGVMAVIVGAATLLPNYQIRFFIFDIKLKYIAFVMVVTSILGMMSVNPGGNLAHLGGVIAGYLYIRQLKKHTFLDVWEEKITRFMRRLAGKRKDEKKMYRTYTSHMKVENDRRPDQAEIDAILDKISKSGYDSLTRAEREMLFKASKEN